jgi:hypothetical protein
LAAAAPARDERLADLKATLASLRASAGKVGAVKFPPSPELTVAKHQLRDWIETQLDSVKGNGDEKSLAGRLNQELKSAGLVREAEADNILGFLGTADITAEPGALIVTTALGILCQYDTSAYVYRFVNGHWQRVWESEQDDYSPKKYMPQQAIDVHVWPSGGGPFFVMTLGNEWGCASTWHTVHYRVWQVEPPIQKLLIDGSETAWLRANGYLVGSIGQDRTNRTAPVDVLVEFAERSIGDHNREAVRHYLIDGDQVRRADPVALSPRDFVDEWLTRPWSESSTWSESPVLRERYQKLHSDFVAGEFVYPTMHCQTPDLWQVGFEPHDAQKNFGAEPKVYFLIRWRPPYHFTIVDVGDKPWPRCTEEDPDADAWRTLFNTQEWRQ